MNEGIKFLISMLIVAGVIGFAWLCYAVPVVGEIVTIVLMAGGPFLLVSLLVYLVVFGV